MSAHNVDHRRFEVEGVEVRSPDVDADRPVVNQIRLKTAQTESGYISAKPRIYEEQETAVNGVDMTSTKERKPTMTELKAEFPELYDIVMAAQGGETFMVEAPVHEWRQDEDPDADSDETYHWLDDKGQSIERVDNDDSDGE